MPTFDPNPMFAAPPLAAIDGLAALCSLLMGISVAWIAWWVWSTLSTDDAQQGDEWRFDVSRINELRRLDPLFRLFQPVVQAFAKLNRRALPNSLPEIGREIQAAGLPRYWLPEEYLGRAQLVGLLMMPAYIYLFMNFLGSAGIFTGIMFGALTAYILRRRLTRQARRRLLEIKRRMPFLLDLMTLLMEAGSSLLQALQQAVHEFQGHPIAIEFGRVLTDMNMGKARSEAFDNLRHRLNDDEINNIVGSILQSEELGTPISDIFRTQADVLRVKRSQRAETVAGEAGVNMLLPGVLVMAAAVLIILGPFMLNYMYSGLGI